jgi:hypothetical protein
LSNIKEQLAGHNPPYKTPVPDDYYTHTGTNVSIPTRKANAAIVMLARNTDLKGIIASMKQMEDRFNKKFHYPYVFLNEQPFSDQFKTCVYFFIFLDSRLIDICRRVTELTDSNVQFGLIPRDHWYQPDWIDETKATAAREDMIKNQVIYGGMYFAVYIGISPPILVLNIQVACRTSISIDYISASISRTSEGIGTCAVSILVYVSKYTCHDGPLIRFQFFYKHELLKPFKYYWRVECVKVTLEYAHYSQVL